MIPVDGGPVVPWAQAYADSINELTGITHIMTYPGHEPDQQHALDIFATRQQGDAICQFAIDHWEHFALDYIIWRQQIYNPEIAPYWRMMEDRHGITQNHFDHVHQSFEPSGEASPDIPQPAPERTWMPGSLAIINLLSRKVLDVKGASDKSGSDVIQWKLHGGLGQLWLPEVDQGGIRFHPTNNPGLSLDADRNGGKVTVFNNDPAADWQIWDQAYLDSSSGPVGEVVLVNRHTGKALNVEAWQEHAGARIIQSDRKDGLNERWTYAEIG